MAFRFIVFFLLSTSWTNQATGINREHPSASHNPESEARIKRQTDPSGCSLKHTINCHPYGKMPYNMLCLNGTLTLTCICPTNSKTEIVYTPNDSPVAKDGESTKHSGNVTTTVIRINETFLATMRKNKLTGAQCDANSTMTFPTARACNAEECANCTDPDKNYCSVNTRTNLLECTTPKKNQKEPVTKIGLGSSSSVKSLETVQLRESDTALIVGNTSFCRTHVNASAQFCKDDNCTDRVNLEGSCQSGWRISQSNFTQFRHQIQIHSDVSDTEIIRLFVIPNKILFLGHGESKICILPGGTQNASNEECQRSGINEWHSCIGPHAQTFNITGQVKAQDPDNGGREMPETQKTIPASTPWWMWLLIGMALLVFTALLIAAVVLTKRKRKEFKGQIAEERAKEGVDNRFQPPSAISGEEVSATSGEEESRETQQTTATFEEEKRDRHSTAKSVGQSEQSGKPDATAGEFDNYEFVGLGQLPEPEKDLDSDGYEMIKPKKF